MRFIIVLMFAVFLVACGSDDSKTDIQSEVGQLKSGYVIQGLKYKSGAVEGYTDDKGQFRFQAGEDITFSVGNYELGTVAATSQVTLAELSGLEAPDSILFQQSFSLYDSTKQYYSDHQFSNQSDSFVKVFGYGGSGATNTYLLSLLDEDSNLSNGVVIPQEFSSIAEREEFTMFKNFGFFGMFSQYYQGDDEQCNLACLLKEISNLQDVVYRQYPNDKDIFYMNFPDVTYKVLTEETEKQKSFQGAFPTETITYEYDEKGYMTHKNGFECNRYDQYGNLIYYVNGFFSNCKKNNAGLNSNPQYLKYGPLNYQIYRGEDPNGQSEYEWEFYADGRVKQKTKDSNNDGVYEYFYSDGDEESVSYEDIDGDGNYERFRVSSVNGDFSEYQDVDDNGVKEYSSVSLSDGSSSTITVINSNNTQTITKEGVTEIVVINSTEEIKSYELDGFSIIEEHKDIGNNGHIDLYRMRKSRDGTIFEALWQYDSNQDGEYDITFSETGLCDDANFDLCTVTKEIDSSMYDDVDEDLPVRDKEVTQKYIKNELSEDYFYYSVAESMADDCAVDRSAFVEPSECFNKTEFMENDSEVSVKTYFDDNGTIIQKSTSSRDSLGNFSSREESYDDSGKIIERRLYDNSSSGDYKISLQQLVTPYHIDEDGKVVLDSSAEPRLITLSVTAYNAANKTSVDDYDTDRDGSFRDKYDRYEITVYSGASQSQPYINSSRGKVIRNEKCNSGIHLYEGAYVSVNEPCSIETVTDNVNDDQMIV